MVMWLTLSLHPADARVLTFRRTDFFAVALFAKNAAIGVKCIENDGGKLHSQQRAASGAPSEIVKESFMLLHAKKDSRRLALDFQTLRPII